MRADEEWARQVIQRHLSRPVYLHDDGSQNSMYDLRVGPADNPEIAIECVKDADPDSIRVWKKGPSKGVRILNTKGDWVIELSGSAKVKTLESRLGTLLCQLHALGIHELDLDPVRVMNAAPSAAELAAHGVVSATCTDANGEGRISYYMTNPGGITDPTGKDLTDWVAAFLASENHGDVLHKLAASRARERHVCIIMMLNGTSTVPLLSHFLGPLNLPADAPTVPVEVTGIWLLLPSNGAGMFWSASGWRAVSAETE
jgi:hypothetical protein